MNEEQNINRKINVLLLWDSATGNTKWAVDKLAEYLIEFNFTPYKHRVREKLEKDVTEFDFIGFCYPVFAFKPMLTMIDYFYTLPPGGGKPCFLFHTNGGGPYGSSRYFAKKLTFKGYSVLSDCSISMIDSWPILRTLKFISKYPENIHDLADQDIYTFASTLYQTFLGFIHGKHEIKNFKPSYSPINWVRVLFNKKFLGKFLPIIVDLELCIRCRKCEEVCPTGRINLAKFPKPKGDCIGCYGCINICPTKAINSLFTSGKFRYKGPNKISKNEK